MLRADDLDGAAEQFKLALQEKPDDHRSVFCLGVTCEMKHDYDGALKYYKQACGMQDVGQRDLDTYLAARQRLSDHKDRIRKAADKTKMAAAVR
jgi:hypothetical protein